MGQKIVYFCDCCTKESESADKWLKISPLEQNGLRQELSVCSLDCLITQYGRDLTILQHYRINLTAPFLMEALNEYNALKVQIVPKKNIALSSTNGRHSWSSEQIEIVRYLPSNNNL